MTNHKDALEWIEQQERHIHIGRTCQICGNSFPILSMCDTSMFCPDCMDALKTLVDIVREHREKTGGDDSE